ESIESLVQGAPDIERCHRALGKLFTTLATWYTGSDTRLLGDWFKVFRYDDNRRFMLFGKYDLARRAGREKYAGALAWDTEWVKEAHLSHRLLGKNKDGLLYRLMQM